MKIEAPPFKDIYSRPEETEQLSLLDNVSHIKEDRTAEDLLFHVMTTWGMSLSLPLVRKTIEGHEILFVGGNTLIAGFVPLSATLIDKIAAYKPLRFVSSEKFIEKDEDKTNFKERFKQLSPETEVKFI